VAVGYPVVFLGHRRGDRHHDLRHTGCHRIPIVDYYNVTADNAANRLSILAETADGTTVAGAHTNGTIALHVNGTTGFVADGYVAIENATTQKFEVNKVASIGVATLTLAQVTENAYADTTKVKVLSEIYSLPVGNATVVSAAALPGKRGKTMGWHLNGSVSCRINEISGHYSQ
jgi:hypothetical protein